MRDLGSSTQEHDDLEHNDLVEMAAAICGTPAAMLIPAGEKQWPQAAVGMPVLPRDGAAFFCACTLAQTGLLEVPDTTRDPRFAGNPCVTGGPHVRFYAGMPLVTTEGQALGTICVVDFEPRRLTSAQANALEALSRQTLRLLELRVAANRMERRLTESASVQAALRETHLRETEAKLQVHETEAKLQVACRAGKVTLWDDDLQTQRVSWSQSQEKSGETKTDEASEAWTQSLARIHPDDRERVTAARAEAIANLSSLNVEIRVLHPDQTLHWLLLQGEVSTDDRNVPQRIIGSMIDITERKQSEEALRLSEERLRGIIVGAPLILFSLDAAGTFTLSEGKGLELIGQTPGEAVGRSAYEMHADSPDFLRHLERAYGGEAFSDHCGIDDLTFEAWYSPVFGEDGHVASVVGVACDSTARRQVEEALRNSEARFQAFMDNNPTFAYVKDEAGRYVYCNDAFDRLSGLSAGDCIGRTALDLWPGELGKRLHADTLEALEKRRLTETLTEVPDTEGNIRALLTSRFTFQDSSGTLFIGCLAMDATEQKRAEQQWRGAQQNLEAALSQLNATLESTTDGLLVVDLQAHILRANKMFYDMWRLFGEMVQNQDETKLLEVILDQLCDPDAFLSRIQELYSHLDKTSFDVLMLKDGRIFEQYSRPLLIQETHAGRVWSFRDVTQQEQTRRDMIRAKNHALASAQAKSEFLANMSHEIRTPMNGILGMSDLLLSTALQPQQKHFAATIKNSADSLLTVINDILDFSKIEAGKMTLEMMPFSIAQVMLEVKDLLGPRAEEKRLSLFCVLPPDCPPFLAGDPARLRQILTNLVGNALKFTERGKVVLEVRIVRETLTHAELRLSVRDTGIGIPKDRQAAIFDSFTQADGSITRRYGGTGLGLAICLRLTDLMAGRIGLESEPGRGSEFWLTVTLEKTDAVLETPSASLWPAETEPLGLRVLLAEDNVINQEVACGFLEMWGCTVDVAVNGWQACRFASEKKYDLVLMDIQMPEMDGRQATAYIRRDELGTARHLPVIAMTAHNMQGDRDQCLACGMDDYVSKPVDPDELLGVLKRWGRCLPPGSVPAPALPAPPAPPRPPVLDLERLHRSCANKAKLERRVIEETLRATPAILERLTAAVQSANAELSRFEAHTLKGSSRTLGAEALGDAAAALENAARAGEMAGAPALLSQMDEEWASLKGTLEDCLAREPWKEAA